MPKRTPVEVKGFTLAEVLAEHAKRAAQPQKPLTPEEEAELDRLIAELSKDPGFMHIQIGGKK